MEIIAYQSEDAVVCTDICYERSLLSSENPNRCMYMNENGLKSINDAFYEFSKLSAAKSSLKL